MSAARAGAAAADLSEPAEALDEEVARARRPLGLMLAIASGAAGLGYEIAWTEQLGLALGHEFIAVLAVLAAFFGGLSAGSWALSRAIERSVHPGRWYAACEGLLALWALALSAAMPAASAMLARWIGPQPTAAWHWNVAFLGPFLLLLPATLALGASLPALERVFTRNRVDQARLGALYAANSFGAVLGVLLCRFAALPRFGLAGATRACAAANTLCALLALICWRTLRVEPAQPARELRDRRQLSVALTLSGVLGIGYEVLAVRVLSQVSENTVYTFAMLLAIYLVGAALGGAIHRRWVAEHVGAEHTRDRLIAATALACLAGATTLWFAGKLASHVSAWLADPFGRLAAAVAGELSTGLAALLLPATAMGALFSQLCVEAKGVPAGRQDGAARRSTDAPARNPAAPEFARIARLGFANALAWNTFGAALAPMLFGLALIPLAGAKCSLLMAAIGYWALLRPRAWTTGALPIAGAALALGLALGLPPLVVVDVPAGGRLVRYQDGVAAAVSVIEDSDGVLTLRINNRPQEGSSAALLSDARQAWLPLLLHPAPRRALFLGLGTGVSAGSAAWDEQLQVRAIELLPEVVTASALFTATLESSRRPEIVVSDARRYVRAATTRYDVIVADLFHPARSGSGALYTAEHFAAVRDRLAAGGLFCQWLPLHQLDLPTLRSIVASFVQVYPDSIALLATNSLDTPLLGLAARSTRSSLARVPSRTAAQVSRASADEARPRAAENGLPHPFALSGLQARVAAASQTQSARLSALRLEDAWAVVGSLIAGPSALRRFAAGAPPNTDDRPIVAQRAPRLTYAAGGSARERLLALLREVDLSPDEVLAADDASRARVAAYWAARDRYLELGTRVRPSEDPRAMWSQLGEPLLALVRSSPEFRPAYDPLLNIARGLARYGSPQARELLAQLMQAAPDRSEARELLERLRQPANEPP